MVFERWKKRFLAARRGIIRIAPIPLYNAYHEIWRVVQILREIIDGRMYEKYPTERKLIP